MKGETKKERFKRIGEKRVQRILDDLKSLSQCSNKRMYAWSDEQLDKIWEAIESTLGSCKESFNKPPYEEFRL